MTRLSKDQRLDLEILHTQFVIAVDSDELMASDLEGWLGSVKLWYIVAAQLGKWTGRMQEQVKLAERMLTSYHEGELVVTDLEFDTLRIGVYLMRQLAERCTQQQASAAADAAEIQTNQFIQELYHPRHQTVVSQL